MDNRFIDELIEKADIVDIIGRYVKLQKQGANYFGLCPFHPDTTPSMSVSPKKKIFKCFSCGASGNVITFIQKYKKVSGSEAIKLVAQMSGYSDEQINKFFNHQNKNFNNNYWRLTKLNADANDIFKTLLFNAENKEYLQYLLDRKLSRQVIQKFELGFSGKGQASKIIYDLLANKEINPNAAWNEDDLVKSSLINIDEKSLEITDYFRNRITFPVKNQHGDIVAFIARDLKHDTKLKYLTSRETSIFSKSKTLYNFHRVVLEKPQTLVVLEGNIDLMSLYEAGMDETKYGPIALMGTALTQDHINMICSQKNINSVLLWFDNDQAGQLSTITNGIKFLKRGLKVFVVNNTTSYKDVNEMLVKQGKEFVINTLTNPNNPDFISFYIINKLSNVSSINIEDKIKEIFAMIRKYGDALWWTKYATLISNFTKIAIDDITNSYKDFVTREFKASATYDFEKTETKQTSTTNYADPTVKNLLKSFNDLLGLILLRPDMAESVFDEMEYKQSNVPEINDAISIIKHITINPKADVKQLVKDLFAKKQIQSKTCNFVLNTIEDQEKHYADVGIKIPVSKSKCLFLVKHINAYFNEIIIKQYKQMLSDDKLSTDQKIALQQKINNLNSKIIEFKKNKNSIKFKV